ncbi:MAG TPA: rhomboid family intramembrane serine protease [Candidatus Latescibacteria bacterium]|nr:rhomboid family intramembrane serine protease [Candidatus Latescibacterota bacterium]
MIPLKDENPTRLFPFVTIGIIVTNVVIFLHQISLGIDGFHGFVLQMSVIPYELTHFVGLRPENPIPTFLTPITAMFTHGGFLHIAGNMLYLWIFGNNVEDILGHFRFTFFYIGCGIIATFFQILLQPNSTLPMVGASGAIAGVLGAYLIRFPGARIYTLFFFLFFIRIVRIPAVIVLGFWFLIQLTNAISSLGMSGGGVAWFAHIGGFITGMIVMAKYRRRGRIRVYYRRER